MPTALGSMAIGSMVYIKVNGSNYGFRVVHQGNPSSSWYGSGFDNGTILYAANVGSGYVFATGTYPSTEYHTYVNGTFYNSIDASVRNLIKTVTIPYRSGTGSSAAALSTVSYGANGYSTRIFAPSFAELGISASDIPYNYQDHGVTTATWTVPTDGVKWSYFDVGMDSSARAKRGYSYYLRSQGIETYFNSSTSSTEFHVDMIFIGSTGNMANGQGVIRGYSAAFVLPNTVMINDDGTIFINSAPTVPSSITVPQVINGGSSIQISWGTSTDPDGNFAGYRLEKSINGGSSWSQIYQGSLTSYADTVILNTISVMYRVKAYDTLLAESGYRTSSQVFFINKLPPAAPARIDYGEPMAGKSILITLGTEG